MNARMLTLICGGILITVPLLSAQAGGNAEAGKVKAAGCASCHGANGEGVGPNPALAGLAPDAFITAMNEYKNGTRDNAMMKALAASTSEEDIADLAAYYASLKK